MEDILSLIYKNVFNDLGSERLGARASSPHVTVLSRARTRTATAGAIAVAPTPAPLAASPAALPSPSSPSATPFRRTAFSAANHAILETCIWDKTRHWRLGHFVGARAPL